MHAIGHFIQDHFPNMRMLYLPSEMFTNGWSPPSRTTRKRGISQPLSATSMLMLDDIQFIAGRDSTQEEFFHHLQRPAQRGQADHHFFDKPPREIARLEERLRSRFEWGLIADIQKPDFDTRIAILRKKRRKTRALKSATRCWSSSPDASRATSASWKVADPRQRLRQAEPLRNQRGGHSPTRCTTSTVVAIPNASRRS